ncbi:MAG TPA: substrate-binding domain-containing protein [Amycolatopsis sp.]|nr:substrate-binding domain-containing protein [Amycolatopsis sp.]
MTGRRTTSRLVAVLAALALTLTGCSRLSSHQGGGAAHPVIGFTVYNMTSYITLGKAGVDREAQALGAQVLWRTANNDVNNQVSQLQSFINQGVDAIVIAPVNAATLKPEIEQARAKGIPVFITNLTLDQPMSGMTQSYVGADDVAAGEQEMRAMAQSLGGKGNIVLLQGPLGGSGEIDRTKGVLQELAKYPGIHLLAQQTADWDRNEAYNVMNNWLSAFGTKIDAVVSENDDMAIGSLRSLATRGLVGKTKVVGIDGLQDALDRVRSGEMIATNLQNAPLQLGMAVAVAVRGVRGQAYPKEALMTMPLVTKSNVDVIYDRLYTHRDAYFQTLPQLIESNLSSGDYGRQSLTDPAS